MNASGEPRMDLEKLRELSDAATPGPWKLGPARSDLGYYPGANRTVLDDRDAAVIGYWSGGRLGGGSKEADAAFIVAAVEYVRSVLSQPETLDAAWKEAEAALPEGWWFQVDCGGTIGEPYPDERWRAKAGESQWSKEYRSVEVYADTPAEALRNLATRLKEGKE